MKGTEPEGLYLLNMIPVLFAAWGLWLWTLLHTFPYLCELEHDPTQKRSQKPLSASLQLHRRVIAALKTPNSENSHSGQCRGRILIVTKSLQCQPNLHHPLGEPNYKSHTPETSGILLPTGLCFLQSRPGLRADKHMNNWSVQKLKWQKSSQFNLANNCSI